MNAEPVRLLVLGVGGNVSQGILKALAAASQPSFVVGGCISTNSMGLYLCDLALLTPLASDSRFADWVLDTCRQYRIQGILSGVEPILNVLAAHRHQIEEATGARVIVSPPDLLRICGDKLLTANWLRDHGFGYPRSADSGDAAGVERLVAECGYHLFAKPRDGKGAHGIFAIRSAAELKQAVAQPHYVIQEYLGHPDQEFTAATFTDRHGRLRGCIVMQRELREGTTVSARIVSAPEVRAEVVAIAEALQPSGPCNMQLRLVDGRPVCFEINLRYSGTTPIRAHFGFNDVEAGVRNLILGQDIPDLPHITRGTALRFWNEIYLQDDATAGWSNDGVRTNPRDAVEALENCRRRT